MLMLLPMYIPGYLVVRINVVGSIELWLDGAGRDLAKLLPLRTDIQPFEINELDDLDGTLKQLQIDLYALVERAPKYLLGFQPTS